MVQIDESQVPVCKVLGHAWSSVAPPPGRPAPRWGWTLALRCDRCGRERYDTIDRLGNISTRSYEPRTGWTAASGKSGEKPKMSDYRRMARKNLDRGKG